MPGKGITSEKAFVEKGMKSLCEHMALDGAVHIFNARIAPAMSLIRLCKAGDRRVLGYMNDLVFQAKCCLLETTLPLELVNMRLNETPVSILKYDNPKLSLLALPDSQDHIIRQ